MSGGIIIIGGGQAGGQATLSLRQQGYQGDVTLIASEPYLPYQRPPLSKQVLQNEWPVERCFLRPESIYEDQGIHLRLGSRVDRIDADRMIVELSDGETLGYDNLVIATGADLRRLDCPGTDLDGVCYLRDIPESVALAERISSRPDVLIVGAGFIGLEVAAAARSAGCRVTVIDIADRVLTRGALPAMASEVRNLHEVNGVEFQLGTGLTEFHGKEGRLTGAMLSNGESVPCTLAVVGIGVSPNSHLAKATGLTLHRGCVLTDEFCRTSSPAIYAIGDVACQQRPDFPVPVHLESVQNALSQAKAVAASLSGTPTAVRDLPTFWSDQFTSRLQIAGIHELAGSTTTVVERIDQQKSSFSVFTLNDGVIVAAQVLSDPAAFMAARKLISGSIKVDLAKLSDPSVPVADAAVSDHITVNVTDRDGEQHQLEAATDQPLMEVLCDLSYGVDAICGGLCSCGTCHVFVDESWVSQFEPLQADEDELLESLESRTAQSRLSCQLRLKDHHDGLKITIAPDE